MGSDFVKTKGVSHEDVIIAASAIPVAGADGKPLRRIRLLPMGAFTLKDGRGPFRVTDLSHARRIAAAVQAYWGAEDMPLDYDHQTLATKDSKGGRAPASAWVKPANVTAEADGVYANDIDWTRPAAARIADKEYRYFSPLMGTTKSGDVTNIYGGGLTNDPAIGGLTTVAASAFHPHKEPEMDTSALAVSLGLAADATLDQILAAQTAQAARLTAASTALGVASDATAEQITAAAAALKPDAKKVAGEGEVVVPASVFTDLQTRLGALEGDRVAAAVERGRKAGKISPAVEAEMTAWAKRDLSSFEAYLEKAPVIVAAGAQLGGKPAQGADDTFGLTAEEIQAASALGMSLASYAGKEEVKK